MRGVPGFRRFSKHGRHRPGARPGVLFRPVDAMPTRLDLIAYDGVALHEIPEATLEQAFSEVGHLRVLWVRVRGLGDLSLLGGLTDRFDMHRLALEDVLSLTGRAKIEDYDRASFFLGRTVDKGEDFVSKQVAIFWSGNFVLSFEEDHADSFAPIVKRLHAARGRIRELGSDYLAYALIDKVVDDYGPVLEAYDDLLDGIEEDTLASHGESTLQHLHMIRAQLTELRRMVRPLRDAVAQAMQGEAGWFSTEVQLFLRDTHDHAAQAMESCDALRENLGSVMDLVFSLQSQRMNDIIKVLTIISTIFIPLSFLAGLYGMNFDTSRAGNMPELGQPYAYVVLLSIMLVLALGMLWWFWRRGWILRRERR